MNKNISIPDIKLLAWDLDGTLYQSQKELSFAMADAFTTILSEKKNINKQEANELLSKSLEIYKGVTKSLEALGCGDRISIIKRVEELVDKASYLKIDQKLQKMFQDLSSFRHAITSDTTHATIEKELEALGLSGNLFESIVGVDDAKTTKPDKLFYQHLLKSTNLEPKNYLVIGDRPQIDLSPARELGMKTCLVWSQNPEPSESLADFVLPTVYNVTDLFKQ